jgi:hypothetical protein
MFKMKYIVWLTAFFLVLTNLLFVGLSTAADVLTSANFPANRGQCLTGWIKDATRNLDWDAIRAKNQQVKATRHHLTDEVEVQVGDTMTFWSWNLSVMPPLWIRVPATCRAVGDSCYIFVADNQWNIHMNQANVDTVLQHFEHHTLTDTSQGIVQLDVENFGTIPDELDHDRHVYIFYSALGSFAGSVFDGYFSVYNEMTEAQAQSQGAHSNEVEMFYMTCYPLAPAEPQRLSVLAHELEHMIHWNMDPDEDTWVDEGCAEVAMWLYGLPDPITGFPSNPDDNLLVWGQQWTDYIETYLFMMYLHDQYGGADMIRTLVAEPQNSTAGVEQALNDMGYSDLMFQDVFVNWTVANFMDDTTYADGIYGYFSIDLPAFACVTYSNYPVPETGSTVNPWATDYYKFTNGYSLETLFDGADDTQYGLPFVMKNGGEIYSVIFGELGAGNITANEFPGFGIDYPEVVMVVARTSSAGSNSYRYSADASASGVAEITTYTQPDRFALSSIYPNPFNSTATVSLEIPTTGNVQLAVFDILGRNVLKSDYFIPSAGVFQIPITANNWSSGIYFVSLKYQGKEIIGKMSYLK